MKKFTFLFFTIMMLALSWEGTAQIIDVTNGGTPGSITDAGVQVYPLGNHHGFERSASIYSYDQINAYGFIRQLGWYAEEGGKGERPIKIYLRKITSTTYGTGNQPGTWASRIANATVVYTGVLKPIEGWNMITLDVPFLYDQNHLEVLVEANFGGTGNGNGAQGNKIRYGFFPGSVWPHAIWKNDNTVPTNAGEYKNERPQIRLDFNDPEMITVANGFNYDVIAEGTGRIDIKTDASFDGAERYLYAKGYKKVLSIGPRGLPINRILPNLLSTGPTVYKLQKYEDTNNTLQLKYNTSGTVGFGNTRPLSELYLLHASASADGPTTLTGTVNFGDGSTQPITSIISNDWVTGPNDTNVAYKGYGRVRDRNTLPNEYYTDDTDNSTKFYQTAIPINVENLHKTVVGITLTRTDAKTGGIFNLMALAGKAAPKYIYHNTAWRNGNDPSGVSNFKDDILVVNGKTKFTANTNVRNLTIRPEATLEIDHVLNLRGNIYNDGDLVFLSTATRNGELGPVPATSEITGNATVHRYMSANRSYRMVSPAVTTTTNINANWQEGVTNPDSNTNLNPNPGFGTHITGSNASNGFDVTQTGNPSMYKVNVATQQFEVVSNTLTNNLKAGEGYLMMIRGDRSIDLNDVNYNPTETILRAKGELVVGNQRRTFTVNTGDFMLIGNPYQSAVDMKKVLENHTQVNSNHYYMYDPTLAGKQGAYFTVDLLNGGSTPSNDTIIGSSNANRYLQPGQAAQVVSKITGTVDLLFKESHKTPGLAQHTTTNATGNRMTSEGRLSVQLYTQENFNAGKSQHDSFVMYFENAYDNEVTSMDAVKPMNFYENFGRNHSGTYLSIERREMPEEGEVFPLYSSGYAHTDYTLNLVVDGLEESLLFLEDHFTGSSTLLEAGATAYNFSVDANNELSKATDRFSIRTEARLGVEDNSVLAGVRLFPNPLNDNTFYINAPKLDGQTVSITVNDMLGREIANTQQTFSGSTVKIDLSQDLKSGIYMVTISSNGIDKTLRVIKR